MQQADILIVDDQEDIRSLIEGILEDEGYKTRSAKDSQTAQKMIAEREPDLIVLDIWLETAIWMVWSCSRNSSNPIPGCRSS